MSWMKPNLLEAKPFVFDVLNDDSRRRAFGFELSERWELLFEKNESKNTRPRSYIELAGLLMRHPGTLSKWMKGSDIAPTQTFYLIAEVMMCEIQEVIPGTIDLLGRSLYIQLHLRQSLSLCIEYARFVRDFNCGGTADLSYARMLELLDSRIENNPHLLQIHNSVKAIRGSTNE